MSGWHRVKGVKVWVKVKGRGRPVLLSDGEPSAEKMGDCLCGVPLQNYKAGFVRLWGGLVFR